MGLWKFAHAKYIVPAVVVVLFSTALVVVAFSDLREVFGKTEAAPVKNEDKKKEPAQFSRDKNRMRQYLEAQKKAHPELANLIADMDQVVQKYGPELLSLSDESSRETGTDAMEAKVSRKQRALPPQIGTVNYDGDRLFLVRSRFGGELAEVPQVPDTDASGSPTQFRPLRYGDKVKQDDLLAVVWSQTLGTAKAALVDAVSALRLSEDNFARAKRLFDEGALAEGNFKQYQRQLQSDMTTLLTAERSLRFWKMSDAEIKSIKAEAEVIAREQKPRVLDEEMNWARVEIRVPKFKVDPNNPKKFDPNIELTVVEKNTNVNDMLDPVASPPLFKLADMSRLQIWVQPPEEYLPILRNQLNRPSHAKWKIQMHAYPNEEPLDLEFVQIFQSIDPNMRTPIVMGFLPNKESRYLVGQFVTATIFVDADPDTVEIPTNALNEAEGESLVFVETDAQKHEFALRRVAVVQRFKDVSYVRVKLTTRDREVSEMEQAKGKRPIQPLLPGERVATRGVLEMTAALVNLAVQDQVDALQGK